MPLIEIEELRLDFVTEQGLLHAVRGVTLDLRRGEILGIVGESGSGKSVTAHAILGLLPRNALWQSGDIRCFGRSIGGLSDNSLRSLRGGKVGIIFQEPGRSFDPIYPIGKTIAETIRSHFPRLSDGQVRERSLHLLREVNVPNPADRLDNFPHQFSGGLLQRIMIAMALSADPAVLIADEPTTALDATIQAGIIDLLVRLKRERTLSIIFITHNIALIASIADRIAVMYAGNILEEGSSSEVIRRPRHPYTRALLDSIPIFGHHHSTRRLRAIPGSPPNPYQSEPGCPFEPRCTLAVPECRDSLPDLRVEATNHHCHFAGVKGTGHA